MQTHQSAAGGEPLRVNRKPVQSIATTAIAAGIALKPVWPETGSRASAVARDQVLPCVQPVDAAIITAAGLYGDRGSGPDRLCALEAPGHFTGFPDPVF
jgi:hypothetical protein